MTCVCFVILHYHEKSLTGTYACVDSIKKLEAAADCQTRLVIVENGSADTSRQALTAKYSGDKDISLVFLDENLGFARGNNAGCAFAIESFRPDFLIVINNDILFVQPDFIKILIDQYRRERFDILGPNILNAGRIPQNPFYGVDNLATVEKLIADFERRAEQIENASMAGHFWLRCKTWARSMLYKSATFRRFWRARTDNTRFSAQRQAQDRGYAGEIQRGVMLHGSALVFSADYYRRYPQVFYPKTFLYFEEAILHQRVLRDGLSAIYYPPLTLIHDEGMATSAAFNLDRTRFIVKNYLDSARVFRSILLHGEQ